MAELSTLDLDMCKSKLLRAWSKMVKIKIENTDQTTFTLST